MPIRHRNPDGSLSYTQTADENLQNKAQQNVKQLMRTMKKYGERLDSLEAKVSRLLEAKEKEGTIASSLGEIKTAINNIGKNNTEIHAIM